MGLGTSGLLLYYSDNDVVTFVYLPTPTVRARVHACLVQSAGRDGL